MEGKVPAIVVRVASATLQRRMYAPWSGGEKGWLC